MTTERGATTEGGRERSRPSQGHNPGPCSLTIIIIGIVIVVTSTIITCSLLGSTWKASPPDPQHLTIGTMATYFCKSDRFGMPACEAFRKWKRGLCNTCYQSLKDPIDQQRYDCWWNEKTMNSLNQEDEQGTVVLKPNYTEEPASKKPRTDTCASSSSSPLKEEVRKTPTRQIIDEMTLMLSVLKERL